MMTKNEFRKKFHLPLRLPFNFFLTAFAMVGVQLCLAYCDATSLPAVITIAAIIFLMFLVWVGLRTKFKDKLYDEFAQQTHLEFEDFVRYVHDKLHGGS